MKILHEKLKNYIIPPNSNNISEENAKEVLSVIEESITGYRGKSFLWNEKGYTTLNSLLSSKLKGELNTNNLQESFEKAKVGKTIDFISLLDGKFEAEDTAILLLLVNSYQFKSFLNSNTAFACLGYGQKGVGKDLKAINGAIFLKK